MSTEVVPAAPPLLALLRNLALVAAQAPAAAQGKVRLRGMDPLGDGVALELDVRDIFPGVDGAYRVEVAILHTGRESTLCDLRIAEGRTAAKVLNWMRRLVPGTLVNPWLKGKAGGALRMEGDRLLVDHQSLIAWLLRR